MGKNEIRRIILHTPENFNPQVFAKKVAVFYTEIINRKFSEVHQTALLEKRIDKPKEQKEK